MTGGQRVTLNWGRDCRCGVYHWSRDSKPCRHCGGTTHLRDSGGQPSHKACAERLATAELAAAQQRAAPAAAP